MPERDNSNVPILSDRNLRTPISQVRKLGMRTVLVTPLINLL